MFKRGNQSSKPWDSGGGKFPIPILAMLLTVISVAFLFLFLNKEEKLTSSIGVVKQKWDSFDAVVKLNPTVELRNGTDLIWQVPDSAKAILFLVHGCNGRAHNFWDKTSKCPNCVGLPEERLLVLNAIARKFAVIAVSSAGRCWSLGDERLKVKWIIERWVRKEKLGKLPLVALGASSGGYFVSALAADFRFTSIVIMIAEGVFDQMEITKDYPPTLFVHMPKDERIKQRIDEFVDVMRVKGIDVSEIKCMEIPLSPSFLADRIPGLDQTTSVKLYNLFQDKGFIDRSGYMRNDGRAIRWKAALKERNILLPDKSLASHIQEEMNLAFAYHEMTSLQSDRIFDWFESHLS